MARRRKTEVEDLPAVVAPAEESDVPMIPFAHWFDKMLKKGKVRHYQDEALLIFFKKRGLKNTEMEDTYNKMFKNF